MTPDDKLDQAKSQPDLQTLPQGKYPPRTSSRISSPSLTSASTAESSIIA